MRVIRQLLGIHDELLSESSKIRREMQRAIGDKSDFTWYIDELAWQVKDCAERLASIESTTEFSLTTEREE